MVRDSKYLSLGEDPAPFLFLPFSQNPSPVMTLLVRADGNPKNLIAAVRHEVQALDDNLPPFNVVTLAENIDISLFPARFGALLLGGFGLLALVLATVGIYGVMSYSVGQRTHEIGIRMALGAQVNNVLRLVVGQGMLLVSIGVAVGLVAAFALTRVVKSLLYGVSATDLATFAVIALLLFVVALLACYLPGAPRGESRSAGGDTTFEEFAAVFGVPLPLNLTGNGEPERLTAAAVTGNYFQALGVQAGAGSHLPAREREPGTRSGGGAELRTLAKTLWRRSEHREQDRHARWQNL